MPYSKLAPSDLKVWPLSDRKSLFPWEEIAQDPSAEPLEIAAEPRHQVEHLASRMISARERGASVMVAYGAHLVKNGCGPLINWLVENGWVTHIATQGAGIVHDWEYAYQGVSSEMVRDYAPIGRFGSWNETGKAINLAVLVGCLDGLGFGEAIGKLIENDGLVIPSPEELEQDLATDPGHPLSGARADLLATLNRSQISSGTWHLDHPFKTVSVPACCLRQGVPMTVHPGIGYDIFVNHPLFSGAAVGRAAETDVRIFAQSCRDLSGGVYLSIGSAIMSPQVFEKAFSAANNVRLQQGEPVISEHYIAIVDIQDGGNWDWSKGEPPKTNPAYYLRFCKSMNRMGGRVSYICCDNRVVLSNLVAILRSL